MHSGILIMFACGMERDWQEKICKWIHNAAIRERRMKRMYCEKCQQFRIQHVCRFFETSVWKYELWQWASEQNFFANHRLRRFELSTWCVPRDENCT